jgi:hypothetical protein
MRTKVFANHPIPSGIIPHITGFILAVAFTRIFMKIHRRHGDGSERLA